MKSTIIWTMPMLALCFMVSTSPDSLLERFDQYVPLVVPKWIDTAPT